MNWWFPTVGDGHGRVQLQAFLAPVPFLCPTLRHPCAPLRQQTPPQNPGWLNLEFHRNIYLQYTSSLTGASEQVTCIPKPTCSQAICALLDLLICLCFVSCFVTSLHRHLFTPQFMQTSWVSLQELWGWAGLPNPLLGVSWVTWLWLGSVGKWMLGLISFAHITPYLTWPGLDKIRCSGKCPAYVTNPTSDEFVRSGHFERCKFSCGGPSLPQLAKHPNHTNQRETQQTRMHVTKFINS